jgi:ABC-2 type transport system permease protein
MTTPGHPFPLLPWSHAWRVGTALVWNDVKQGLRKHGAAKTWQAKALKGGGLLFGLTFLAALHLAAFSMLIYTGASPTHDRSGLFAGVSTAIWSFLLFVMISGGLMRALVVLHEQDDSSLLLSSPVSPRAILAARLFGNALQSCLVDGFIIIPWIDVRVFVFGQLRFLWGFPVWFAIAIIVTCIDGLFSFGLIRWLGLRRARLFSQAIPFALIFGVTFCAGSLSVSVAQMNLAGGAHMPAAMQARFIELSHTPLVAMARAAGGSVPHLAIIFGTAAAIAVITLRLTERAFVEGTQNLAENAGQASSSDGDAGFRSHLLGLEIRKNLRLIFRTPMMLVQCLAQVLTPVGIAFVLGKDDVAKAVAFFVIFVVGVLAGMLTIAAGTVEECDDLLQMAPRPVRLFRLGKILSGALGPVGLALVAGVVLLPAGHPLEAMAVLFGGIPLAAASSVVGETFATPVKPGVRPKLLADPIMMIPLLGMQITSGLVAGLTVFASAFSPVAVGAALLASYFLLVVAMGLAQLRKAMW